MRGKADVKNPTFPTSYSALLNRLWFPMSLPKTEYLSESWKDGLFGKPLPQLTLFEPR